MNRLGKKLITALLTCTVSLCAVADYTTTILADNPVGYWRLGESGGLTAVDASGNGNDLNYTLFSGSNYGATGAIVSDADTAARLIPNGAVSQPQGNPSDHPSIVSPNNADFGFSSGQSFSFEYWLNAEVGPATADDAGILTKGYDESQSTPWYLSRLNTAGTVDMFLRDSTNASNVVTSSSIVEDGQWHHVVGVYNGSSSSMTLYVDGVMEASQSGIPLDAYGTNARPLTIGNHVNRAIDAAVDEVAIYDSALSAIQVAEHYTEGSGMLPNLPNELNVDFSRTGTQTGGLQSGFFDFQADTTSAVTNSYATSLGNDLRIDVTISGNTHYRNYAELTGSNEGVNPLLSDMVLRNSNGTMTLTLEGLSAGTYELTTYHHSSQFGGGTLDLQLDDANGTNQVVGTSIPISSGTNPLPPTRYSFEVTSDGTNPIALDIIGGANSQHASLNGFSLNPVSTLPPTEIDVLSIDVNARHATESITPGVTQAGFDEFVLDGDPDTYITGPVVRTYGDITVTLSSTGDGEGTAPRLDGTTNDRRRNIPEDGGFFSDAELLKDFIFTSGAEPDEGLDVLVEGLDDETLYLITVWSYDDSSPGARTSDWFANGEHKMSYLFDGSATPPSPFSNDDYKFSFLAKSDGNGNILIQGRGANGPAGSPHIFMNALQISLVPEPGSFLLFVTSGLLLATSRRKRQAIQG